MTENQFDLGEVLSLLAFSDEKEHPLEELVEELTGEGFFHRMNGRLIHRAEYADHFRQIRQMAVGGGDLRTLQEVRHGDQIAARYLFTVNLADGAKLVFEADVFAAVREGRAAWMAEVNRPVEESDDPELAVVSPESR